MKYLDTAIVFQEIPDEITLAIEITNCPHRCKDCHSPQLRNDIGNILNETEIDRLILLYPYISCVCFMGGDSNHGEIIHLSNYIHNKYSNIQVAMYSGDDEIDNRLINTLNYYKVGSYKKEFGPLNNKNTNQHLYKINSNNRLIDITNRFWNK